MARTIILTMLTSLVLSCTAESSIVPEPNLTESMNNAQKTTVSSLTNFSVESLKAEIRLQSTTSPNLIDKKLIAALSTVTTSSSIETTAEVEKTTLSVLQKWQKFENLTKIFAKKRISELLRGLMEGEGNLNVSTSCRRDVFKLLVGLRDIKTWAFSFIDASGKLIDGMLSGTMASLGEYDQCVDIKATDDRKGRNYGKVMFTGQYCALDIKPPLPPKPKFYKLNDVSDELKNFSQGTNIINEAAKASQFFQYLSARLAICVPSGCQKSDIQQVVGRIADDIEWTINVKRCELKEKNEFTPLIIGVMIVLSFFGLLMLIGSLIDIYHYYCQKKINSTALQVFVCFSLVSNFKKLVNTKTSSGSLNCLHGFRFLSISWIIVGHTYLNANFQIMRGLRKATIFQVDFFFQAVVNATVAVDTFFFMGGFLVCYATLKVIRETKRPFNILVYILHRVFRLLPLYIIIILFMYMAPILGSGPVWHDSVDKYIEACYKNWWTNILFINNFMFINAYEICLPQSWYVSCDMQLYLAALIVLLPMLKWPRVGLSIAVLGILASAIGIAAMTYAYDYPPTMLFVHPVDEQIMEYSANAYYKPYSHAGPYCIGLLTGYLLATRPKIKFSLRTRIIGWCLAIACNLSVLYGVYDWNSGRDPMLVETILYSGLHRIAWTAGVAWVVVNCATGQGGVVNYILSWKCWVPLGRLTYAAYLIHPIVQIAAVGNARMTVMTAHYFAVWMFFGHLLITYGSSFAASMLVEAPFLSLEKMILNAFAGKRPQQRDAHSATSGAVSHVSDEEQCKKQNGERHLNGSANKYVSQL